MACRAKLKAVAGTGVEERGQQWTMIPSGVQWEGLHECRGGQIDRGRQGEPPGTCHRIVRRMRSSESYARRTRHYRCTCGNAPFSEFQTSGFETAEVLSLTGGLCQDHQSNCHRYCGAAEVVVLQQHHRRRERD